MTDHNPTQSEADALLALAKYCLDQRPRDYPPRGIGQTIELFSQDKREVFLLDVERSSINLSKGKYQTRARQIVILARLCFGGPPHRNPDGEDVPRPHIHIYREGFADKWAFQLPVDDFSNQTDLWALLQDFMGYCNIVERPTFQGLLQ